jgi:hypothetical protein
VLVVDDCWLGLGFGFFLGEKVVSGLVSADEVHMKGNQSSK